jgi:hypothetical protein
MQIDKIKPSNEPLDAFSVHGYRLLVLELIVLNLKDLLKKDKDGSEDKAIVNDAKFWFDPIKGQNAAVTLESALSLAGSISNINTVREIAFSGDATKIEQLIRRFEMRLTEHKSHIRRDAFQDSARDNFVVEPGSFENLKMAFS